MPDGDKKRVQGKCVNCRGPTELLEWDFRKGLRVLRCQQCGFLHYYKKDVFGWKLTQAAKAE